MQSVCPANALTSWQRRALISLAVLAVLFGCLVLYRSAFLTRRMGDLGCYLRAAWAIRSGGDLYGITDDNDWHYNYPPLLAIILTPLADPPQGTGASGFVPYSVSVVIWYLVGLICLGIGVHCLANVIERLRSDDPPGSQAWWRLRILPVCLCLPMLGHSLMRGQANLIVVALICGMAAGLMSGRRFTAGMCLAGAACIKLFPAFLILYPLFRRDVRCLAGAASGAIVGLVLIPCIAFGPQSAFEHYRTYASVLLGPALGQGGDASRAEEILATNSTDSQAFKEVIHNTLYPKVPRPKQLDAWVMPVHFALGGVLTLVTFIAAWRRRIGHEPMILGCLMIVAILVNPICHLHYFCYALPLVMGIVVRQPRLSLPLMFIFALFLVCNILPHLPGMGVFRDLGLAMYGTLLLWLVGVVVMLRPHRVRDRNEQPAQSMHVSDRVLVAAN